MAIWNIENAKRSDVNKLMELRLLLEKYHKERNPLMRKLSPQGQEKARHELIELISGIGGCVLKAVDEKGNIIGMVIGKITEDDRHLPSIAGRIERMFILEEWRSRGIGTEFVRRLCQVFAANGVDDIGIGIIAGNDEAMEFWKKFGFQSKAIWANASLRELEGKING